MKVELDLRLNITGNAQAYYERAKKARRKIKGASIALQDTNRKIERLEERRGEACDAGEAPVLKRKEARKKHWFEKFRWFTSSDGLLVVGGKDATSNEILIKKHVEPKDIVFHAELQGAPFFVIKNPDSKDIPETTLNQAAHAAAAYSKGWAGGIGSVNTYWITPDQVSKTPESGEYLTKGAFVIRGKKNFIRHVELKTAIGVKIEEDGTTTVLGGPIDAIQTRTDYQVIIEPGDMKPGAITKKIREGLIGQAKKEYREILKKIPADEIQQWIPTGKGKVVG